jgi:RNA polymerase sigma factor (sigma-70 family)
MTDRLLTAADVTRLARRIEQGDDAAKEEMVVRNLRLVYSLAARYSGRGVSFEDLVQEGTIGLMRAVDKFDHRRGLKFSTYAAWWIRSSLLDALSVGGPSASRARHSGRSRRFAAPRMSSARAARASPATQRLRRALGCPHAPWRHCAPRRS